ncbi:MAG TPA: helix-turn-helix transcriptional regulator [Terriglobales bacterium]|jgi:transcriptional regulator with XRE-family HTH domain|nr:helix-turn-helix transcriptional regulator [Terriglobales bacterium]
MNRSSESFGAVLRRLRRAAKLSQEELAERAKVDFTYISKLENDRVRPPAEETILRICSVLHTRPDELIVASRKIPAELGQTAVSSLSALEFLRQADDMKLTDAEWRRLTATLKRLRG